MWLALTAACSPTVLRACSRRSIRYLTRSCLYRAILGPTTADRIIGINVVGSKSTIALVFLAAIFQKTSFLDIALLYAMLVYVTTLAFVKYLEHRELGD